MSLIDAIQKELSGGSLQALASTLGASPQQTQSAVSVALPLLVAALSHNTSQPSGATALAGALERDHSQPLAAQSQALGGLGGLLQAALRGGNGASLDGAGILGHILGQNQASAQSAVAKSSGLDAATVGKLLLLLAPIVMSSLGTVKQENRLDADGLSGYLAEQNQSMTGAHPGLLGSVMDPAQDGVGMDDLVRMGGLLQQSGLLGKLFG